jgi:hypothetical protein
MPWPVKDRDDLPAVRNLTRRLRRRFRLASRVTGISASHSRRPHDRVAGRWTFVEGGGRTRIDLDMHIEPGGGVPAWLARQKIVGTPTKMLSNLKRHFEAACDRVATE